MKISCKALGQRAHRSRLEWCSQCVVLTRPKRFIVASVPATADVATAEDLIEGFWKVGLSPCSKGHHSLIPPSGCAAAGGCGNLTCSFLHAHAGQGSFRSTQKASTRSAVCRLIAPRSGLKTIRSSTRALPSYARPVCLLCIYLLASGIDQIKYSCNHLVSKF
jgi:hypothetical protein